MASLEKRGGRFRIVFRFAGRKFQHPLNTGDQRAALRSLSRLEENLIDLERGKAALPPEGVDLGIFLLSDGKVGSRTVVIHETLTLRKLADDYFELHSAGALEGNSIKTMRTHLRHLGRTLGEEFPVKNLTLGDLQKHVSRRSLETGIRGRPLSVATLRKEIASFRAVWNWGLSQSKVSFPYPNKGLVFHKSDEKPPFCTRVEIDRRIARGGLSESDVALLWECLFLTLPEVSEFLSHVEASAAQPWLYPMVAFAAHTGARRSEMCRVLIDDVDFEGGTVLIREKKRGKGKRTNRRIALSPFLVNVLKDWLANHPGGQSLFVQQTHVVRSKTEREGPTPITPDEAHDHFKRVTAGGKWSVLRGWHVLRHSFASNCAARGIDERTIDSWMGHQTEEMRKRYRHLLPDLQREAIATVFSESA